MSVYNSSLTCIIIFLSLFYADSVVYADSIPSQHESVQGIETYEESNTLLQEEYNERESMPPSYYEFYPDSDELDIFDDEDEASYCS